MKFSKKVFLLLFASSFSRIFSFHIRGQIKKSFARGLFPPLPPPPQYLPHPTSLSREKKGWGRRKSERRLNTLFPTPHTHWFPPHSRRGKNKIWREEAIRIWVRGGCCYAERATIQSCISFFSARAPLTLFPHSRPVSSAPLSSLFEIIHGPSGAYVLFPDRQSLYSRGLNPAGLLPLDHVVYPRQGVGHLVEHHGLQTAHGGAVGDDAHDRPAAGRVLDLERKVFIREHTRISLL